MVFALWLELLILVIRPNEDTTRIAAESFFARTCYQVPSDTFCDTNYGRKTTYYLTKDIVGASGRLGSTIARQLLSQGKRVRALTRTPAKLEHLKTMGAEVICGDLRDPASLLDACQRAEQVITTAHAGEGTGTNTPGRVDGEGNRQLIEAAKAAGVRHFVFITTHGARPDSPVDLFRFKA
jgi:NAD(P)H-binding